MHNCTNVLLSNFENGKKVTFSTNTGLRMLKPSVFTCWQKKTMCRSFSPMTKERWCVNRTVVPEKRLFSPPQITIKYTVTSKYR